MFPNWNISPSVYRTSAATTRTLIVNVQFGNSSYRQLQSKIGYHEEKRTGLYTRTNRRFQTQKFNQFVTSANLRGKYSWWSFHAASAFEKHIKEYTE